MYMRETINYQLLEKQPASRWLLHEIIVCRYRHGWRGQRKSSITSQPAGHHIKPWWLMTQSNRCPIEIKSRPTASVRLSVYAHWLQTHSSELAMTIIALYGKQKNKTADRRTDATKCIISLLH